MSEKKKLDELLSWFNNQISSSVSSYRNSANKHLRSIFDRIEEVKTAAHRFDYSDIKDPDVYQNYATTIYNKTLEVFNEIKAPEVITFVNLDDFKNSLNNKINSYINILAKYLSWLKRDRSYKNKVKSLDRSLTRLKEELLSFEKKTLISYTEIVNLEKVSDDIETLVQLVKRNKELEEDIESHAEDVGKITKKIDKSQKELDELKNHPGFIQLESNKKELEHIELSITSKISEIKKLCSKVLRAAENRKIELNDHNKELMKNLIKDPLGTLIKEPEGYRGIKVVLQELKEISKNPVIQMKKEKMQRAYENIDEILNDGILEEQKKAKFLIKQSTAIENKFKEMELDVKIKRLEEEIGNLKIDRNRITLSQRREKEEVEEKIISIKKSIEDRVKEYLGKAIQIVL